MYAVFDFFKTEVSFQTILGRRQCLLWQKKGMLWFGAAAYIKQQHITGCGHSYIGAKSYGNTEEGCNVTHTFMNDAVEDEYIHEGKEMHSDDMIDEEVPLDDENEEVALDDENEEVSLDDENEEVTSDDENEVPVMADGENEEVMSDDENKWCWMTRMKKK